MQRRDRPEYTIQGGYYEINIKYKSLLHILFPTKSAGPLHLFCPGRIIPGAMERLPQREPGREQRRVE